MVDGNFYVYFNTTTKLKIKSIYPFTSPQWKQSWRKPSRLWAALWSPECSQGWKSAGAAPSFLIQMNWLRHPEVPWPGEAYSSHTGRSPWTEGSYSFSVITGKRSSVALSPSPLPDVYCTSSYTWVLSVSTGTSAPWVGTLLCPQL